MIRRSDNTCLGNRIHVGSAGSLQWGLTVETFLRSVCTSIGDDDNVFHSLRFLLIGLPFVCWCRSYCTKVLVFYSFAATVAAVVALIYEFMIRITTGLPLIFSEFVSSSAAALIAPAVVA